MKRLITALRRAREDLLVIAGIGLLGLGLGEFHPGLQLIAWGIGLIAVVRFGQAVSTEKPA